MTGIRLSALVLALALAGPADEEGPRFVRSLKKAVEIARERGYPILVWSTMDSDSSSKADQEVLKNKEVQKAMKGFLVVFANHETGHGSKDGTIDGKPAKVCSIVPSILCADHEAAQNDIYRTYSDIAVDKATVALDWEKLRVAFEIQVETVEHALVNARAAMASLAPDDHQTAFRCASFAFQNNVAPDEARQWMDKSISIKETWLNLRVKADMLAKDGKTAEAIQFGEKAIAVGKTDAPADEIAKIEKQVAEWKKVKK